VFFQAGYNFCEFWAHFMRSESNFAHDYRGGGRYFELGVGFRLSSC